MSEIRVIEDRPWQQAQRTNNGVLRLLVEQLRTPSDVRETLKTEAWFESYHRQSHVRSWVWIDEWVLVTEAEQADWAMPENGPMVDYPFMRADDTTESYLVSLRGQKASQVFQQVRARAWAILGHDDAVHGVEVE